MNGSKYPHAHNAIRSQTMYAGFFNSDRLTILALFLKTILGLTHKAATMERTKKIMAKMR